MIDPANVESSAPPLSLRRLTSMAMSPASSTSIDAAKTQSILLWGHRTVTCSIWLH